MQRVSLFETFNLRIKVKLGISMKCNDLENRAKLQVYGITPVGHYPPSAGHPLDTIPGENRYYDIDLHSSRTYNKYFFSYSIILIPFFYCILFQSFFVSYL